MRMEKTMKQMLITLVALVFLVGVAGSALAFVDSETGEGGVRGATQMAAGAGLVMVPDYEGSDDYTARPLLLFQSHYKSGRFVDLFANRLRVNLLPNAQYYLGPVLQYRAKRDNDVDDDQVSRMKEVDTAIEAGVFGGFALNNWIVSIQYVLDVSDAHDGSLVTLSGGYRYVPSRDLTLMPTLSATYADSDYMQTYFGVSAGNRGTSTLPNFKASSGLKDVTAALLVDYHPWQHWKLVGGAGFKSLLGDASDSPLVDQQGSDSQLIVGIMAAYQF
ncbi:hypothetical protein B5V00_07395 [Geothermobacter hydrogeniphilus]|uniref:Outer membrane protein n=2 Tax=Geothermobacter hydrogeniphilus TaxID=1969733 RepID=A0A1X0Y628_9BACT|nr:hypothetical protein B5V00_07395 [Geothermobacter hydrogeniphilus]